MTNNTLFHQLPVEKLTNNPFQMIGKDWFLITAGTSEKYNTMTAAWGHFGVLWNRNTAVVYVRPTRFTHQFLIENSVFTLSFFNEKYREILNYCGSVSGRDSDKVKGTNLHDVFDKNGAIYFEESEIVFTCKKIYTDIIKAENLQDENINKHYPLKDYHHLFIGEIIDCLIKN